jgi:hypothetical protein
MLGKFINHKEDSLTAAVFTHLLHLPSEIFWRLLRNACYTHSLPEFSGDPLQVVEFWPNWSPEGTSNAHRVVPDLFIRFASFDLIVEAKRWDASQQSLDQWKKEVTAYANQYGNEGVPVRLIALGGIWSQKDDELVLSGVRCPIHMCTWGRLLAETQRMKKELEVSKYPSSQTNAWLRNLSDLVDLFGWHGYSTGHWFSAIVPRVLENRISKAPRHLVFKGQISGTNIL